jgi:hypothetical protein
MGYDFFPGVFVAEYEHGGSEFRVFLVPCDSLAECRQLLDNYPALSSDQIVDTAEGRYTVEDPYHGTVFLQWKGNFIWGILDLTSAEQADQYLSHTEELIDNAMKVDREREQ